ARAVHLRCVLLSHTPGLARPARAALPARCQGPAGRPDPCATARGLPPSSPARPTPTPVSTCPSPPDRLSHARARVPSLLLRALGLTVPRGGVDGVGHQISRQTPGCGHEMTPAPG